MILRWIRGCSVGAYWTTSTANCQSSATTSLKPRVCHRFITILFDRVLAAQAIVEGFTLLTTDSLVSHYRVRLEECRNLRYSICRGRRTKIWFWVASAPRQFDARQAGQEQF